MRHAGGLIFVCAAGGQGRFNLPWRGRSRRANCRDFFETGQNIFAHANYLPHLPMEKQPHQFLRWEFLDPLWAKAHCSGKMVIVGHTSQKGGEVLDLGFLKCIDTYCYGGKWLTALDVGTGQVWQADQQGRTESSNSKAF